MTDLMQRIIESKRARRKELAALPVGEKLRILAQMVEATRRSPPPARPSRRIPSGFRGADFRARTGVLTPSIGINRTVVWRRGAAK